jgi:hypothetical protein
MDASVDAMELETSASPATPTCGGETRRRNSLLSSKRDGSTPYIETMTRMLTAPADGETPALLSGYLGERLAGPGTMHCYFTTVSSLGHRPDAHWGIRANVFS